IFKLILSMILLQIICVVTSFVPTFIFFGVYYNLDYEEIPFVSESLFFSFFYFLSVIILLYIYRVRTKKKMTDPNFGYEYIEYTDEEPEEKPLKMTKKNIGLCVLLGLGFLLLASSTYQHLIIDIPMPPELEKAFDDIFAQNFMFIFFTMIIEAAFVEEILYRGFALNGLLRKYSPKVAILISAFLFGIVHMNIPQFINAFIGAFLFGVLYFKTKSLWACVILHATNNFFSSFVIIPDAIFPKILISITYIIIGFLLFKKAIKGLELDVAFKDIFFSKKTSEVSPKLDVAEISNNIETKNKEKDKIEL
ncbi:MAG: lysostaphin resistance A-like protein, partial [Sarcina sp.]